MLPSSEPANCAQGWQAIRFFPVGKQQGHLRAARVDRRYRKDAEQGTRGAGRRRRPRRRLSPPAVGGRAASFCNKLGRGVLDFLEEPMRRDTAGLRIPAHDDRHPLCHRRGVCQQVAVPALHRARHPSVQPARCLQCRRAHRGDESRRLERGALCGPDAAQSPWSSVHGRDRASRRGGTQLRVARDQGARNKLGFDNSEFFPVQPRLDGPDYPVSDLPGLGVEVNEEAIQAKSLRFWEAPHLKRRDGSVTNW